MSRFESGMSRKSGTNDRDGTRARIRERDIVPVPFLSRFAHEVSRLLVQVALHTASHPGALRTSRGSA